KLSSLRLFFQVNNLEFIRLKVIYLFLLNLIKLNPQQHSILVLLQMSSHNWMLYSAKFDRPHVVN
ncbi:hypothetical protein BV409_27690, partial [Klebsiella pneumoniae]